MNARTEIALLRPLREVVDEYQAKDAGLGEAVAAFDEAKRALERAGAVGGTYAGGAFSRDPWVDAKQLRQRLLVSAWKHVYAGLNIETIAPLADRQRFERELMDPPPFTIDNIRATFGDYIQRPRHHILKGLAEIFGSLDPAFKSHSKVKVGVQGLPKRIILGGFGSYYEGNGKDKLRDILNAMAAYQGKPQVNYQELSLISKDGEALRDGGEYPDPSRAKYEEPRAIKVIGRGVWIKRFGNGNAHMHFTPESLADVNCALAEFYGDVLPDASGDDEERPAKRASTEVARDLQFYPTPVPVIRRMIQGWGRLDGKRILEPSCGDGRIMDALRQLGAVVNGIEVDPGRAATARAKGYSVWAGNFLEIAADPTYDAVVMNPPFYGRHYFKHVSHAAKWLKPKGSLIAILPVTACTDHGLLNEAWAEAHGMAWPYSGREVWEHLPVGSFSESGTNINTVVFRMTKA